MADALTDALPMTVYFDGACPLCRREIAVLKRVDAQRGALRFLDVSAPDAEAACPLDRATLLARFHVQLADGEIVDGARAFTEVWATSPWLVWLRPIGRFGPSRRALNAVYGLFLRVRPRLQRWAQ